MPKTIFYWRRWADSNRRIRVLQTRALPLGYNAVYLIICHIIINNDKFGAGNGAQTRDLCLGKASLYQLSYSRMNK